MDLECIGDIEKDVLLHKYQVACLKYYFLVQKRNFDIRVCTLTSVIRQHEIPFNDTRKPTTKEIHPSMFPICLQKYFPS